MTRADPRGGTALLEIDWQAWIIELGHDLSAVARARDVRSAARARGWPVVCSRYLSTDSSDPLRSDPDGSGASFITGLGPLPGDAVVTKHGRDVFDVAETTRVLDRLGTNHLVLTGVVTDHGVALAARSAVARGLAVTVVADACAGTSAAAHEEALAGLRAAGVRIVDAAELDTTATGTLTIAEMAERTGLTKDTLRWYENEGLIPSVGRDGNGYRAYDEASVRMIELVIRLRRTGMPVRDTASFVAMVRQGAGTHGRRLALLEDHRGRVLTQLAQLREDLEAIEAKITHYSHLIDEGRDRGDEPVTDPGHPISATGDRERRCRAPASWRRAQGPPRHRRGPCPRRSRADLHVEGLDLSQPRVTTPPHRGSRPLIGG